MRVVKKPPPANRTTYSLATAGGQTLKSADGSTITVKY